MQFSRLDLKIRALRKSVYKMYPLLMFRYSFFAKNHVYYIHDEDFEQSRPKREKKIGSRRISEPNQIEIEAENGTRADARGVCVYDTSRIRGYETMTPRKFYFTTRWLRLE